MTLAARTTVALVHHPVVDRSGRVVTTAVTNLDIHDIARAVRTFGLAGYVLVTPVAAQRDLIARILGHWTEGAGREHNDKRSDALAGVSVVASVEDARAAVTARFGVAPAVVATGARARGATVGYGALRSRHQDDPRPLLLLFGTGWGLDERVFQASEAVLDPIRGFDQYNHLSVRSAVAIVLDRLFGSRDEVAPETHE